MHMCNKPGIPGKLASLVILYWQENQASTRLFK